MKILMNIIEVITSPFTFIFRHSSKPNEGYRKTNAVLILLISLIVLAILLLYAYKDLIFK